MRSSNNDMFISDNTQKKIVFDTDECKRVYIGKVMALFLNFQANYFSSKFDL